MKFNEFYITDSNGNSNCVIRSLCKLYNENYDTVYSSLCNIQKELGSASFNDIEVFEAYMERNNTNKIEYGNDIKIKDLNLDNGSYVILCWDKKDFYHMVTIIDNILYDRTSDSFELYVINIYMRMC